MSIFSVSGLNSGIDYESLISGIMKLERQSVGLLEQKQSDYNETLNAYESLSTKLSTLLSAVDTLRRETTFYAKTASVSDSTVLDATASSSAAVGSYSVGAYTGETAIVLASEEKEVHSGVASSTTAVNSSGSDKVFQYTYAGTQRSITVADGSTLEDLRDLINNDSGNPGVTATILNDGSNYRLVLTGDEQGAAKTITIDAGTTLDGTDSTVDFTNTTFTETKSASDAKFSIDGVDVTRSSNVITDVITGVTFTLKKAATGTSTITVTNDTDRITSNIESFVNAYNDVVSFIGNNSTYDVDTNTGGPLNGESTARNIMDRLGRIISSRVSGLPEDLRALSQIGISTNYKDRTLSIDSSTLSEKLSSNLEGVADIFTDSTEGIANQVYDYIDDEVTDYVDGYVTIRKEGIQSAIDDLADDILALEVRLDKREETLRRQFVNLETLIGNLNAQSSFLVNQLAMWQK